MFGNFQFANTFIRVKESFELRKNIKKYLRCQTSKSDLLYVVFLVHLLKNVFKWLMSIFHFIQSFVTCLFQNLRFLQNVFVFNGVVFCTKKKEEKGKSWVGSLKNLNRTQTTRLYFSFYLENSLDFKFVLKLNF